MKRLKTIGTLALTLMLLLSVVGCSNTGGSASPSTETATLRVGMECAYAPFNWTQIDDANGAAPIEGGDYAGGYDVEIAKLIAAEMGRELVIVKTEWDGLIPAMLADKIDLIIAGMSPSDERREAIDFSDYYYTSDIVLVVRADSEFADALSISDFAGARVTGQLSTLHYDFIDQIEGVDKQPAMDTFPAMVVALTSGRIDAYTSERPGAESAVAANPELTYLAFEGDAGFTFTSDEVSVSVGLKKDSDLMDGVNSALAKIDDEQRQELMSEALINQPTLD